MFNNARSANNQAGRFCYIPMKFRDN